MKLVLLTKASNNEIPVVEIEPNLIEIDKDTETNIIIFDNNGVKYFSAAIRSKKWLFAISHIEVIDEEKERFIREKCSLVPEQIFASIIETSEAEDLKIDVRGLAGFLKTRARFSDKDCEKVLEFVGD